MTLRTSNASRLTLAAVAALVCTATLAAPTLPATAASFDDNVEWGGLSHLPVQDRVPLAPLGGEAFTVKLRSWRDDLTAVRVVNSLGASVAATRASQLGPYDVWEAELPASGPTTRVTYHFEVEDGADLDHYSLDGGTDLAPLADAWFVVDFATLEHAPRGATPHPGGGVVFRVWAPTPPAAYVRGQFNGWGLGNPMSAVGDDFVAFVPNAVVNQRYKFFFDYPNGSPIADTWASDPQARSLDAGDSYNAIIQDPALFPWTDHQFRTPALEEMVIYQLHVGTFAGRNDPLGTPVFPSRYIDVAARVGHLADLGVNAVMLNPINEFPGDLSAGYNPASQFAPERAYGAPNDLKRLVDALHAEGIAVLLDIVWNHHSITDNLLWNFDGTQVYFDDPFVDTPWGAQYDFDRPEVRDHLMESAHSWLGEYHFDGFRMDATDFMNIGAQSAVGWQLMQRLNNEVDNRWADRVVIAEQLPDDSAVTLPTGFGGAGFDAQYFDAFTDRLREEIADAAFGDPEMWKIRDIINGYGAELSGGRVVNYVELHDEAWPTSGGGRLVKSIDPTFPHDDQYARGRTMLAQGLVLTAPGVPAMLMGTEWLEDTDFGTDLANRIDWSKKTTYAGVFAYYRDLVALRTTRADLRADSYNSVFHLNEGANVLAMRRGLTDGGLVVVANFSNNAYAGYRIGVPNGGDWRVLVDSQDAAYGGSGASNSGLLSSEAIVRDGFVQSIQIEIPAMGLLVLEYAPEGTSVGPPSEGTSLLQLLPAAPNPAFDSTLIRFRLPARDAVRISLHDVRGRRVKLITESVLEAGEHSLTLRTDDLARGTYFVRMRTSTSTRAVKLLVND